MATEQKVMMKIEKWLKKLDDSGSRKRVLEWAWQKFLGESPPQEGNRENERSR